MSAGQIILFSLLGLSFVVLMFLTMRRVADRDEAKGLLRYMTHMREIGVNEGRLVKDCARIDAQLSESAFNRAWSLLLANGHVTAYSDADRPHAPKLYASSYAAVRDIPQNL